MARKKKERVQDRLRHELNTGKNFYSKGKLITVIVLFSLVLSLPLTYFVQIPLAILFAVSMRKSVLGADAKSWLDGIDKYAILIWTVTTIAYSVIYAYNLIKLWYGTYDAFSRLHREYASISWLVPMCFRYAILQAEALNEFTNSLGQDVLNHSETWRIYGEYEFIAFSPKYISTNSETYLSFKDLVSPLSMVLRMTKIDSLIATTGTAWILLITRLYYCLKHRKHKAYK